MPQENLFFILEWPDNQPPFPRYSLATRKHADELESHVRRVQTCCSLEMAALVITRLNAAYRAASERDAVRPE